MVTEDDPICYADLGDSWCKMPKSWAGHIAPGIPNPSRLGLRAFTFHEYVGGPTAPGARWNTSTVQPIKDRVRELEERVVELADDVRDLQANHEALTKACLAILPDMPTGYEVAGQEMGTTMRQHRIREWREATTRSAHDLGLTVGRLETDDAG